MVVCCLFISQQNQNILYIATNQMSDCVNDCVCACAMEIIV